ncbi:unnamed protein product, partial [Amoebophrya sp. A25]|eukprot:GSA25T00001463001.1
MDIDEIDFASAASQEEEQQQDDVEDKVGVEEGISVREPGADEGDSVHRTANLADDERTESVLVLENANAVVKIQEAEVGGGGVQEPPIGGGAGGAVSTSSTNAVEAATTVVPSVEQEASAPIRAAPAVSSTGDASTSSSAPAPAGAPLPAPLPDSTTSTSLTLPDSLKRLEENKVGDPALGAASLFASANSSEQSPENETGSGQEPGRVEGDSQQLLQSQAVVEGVPLARREGANKLQEDEDTTTKSVTSKKTARVSTGSASAKRRKKLLDEQEQDEDLDFGEDEELLSEPDFVLAGDDDDDNISNEPELQLDEDDIDEMLGGEDGGVVVLEGGGTSTVRTPAGTQPNAGASSSSSASAPVVDKGSSIFALVARSKRKKERLLADHHADDDDDDTHFEWEDKLDIALKELAEQEAMKRKFALQKALADEGRTCGLEDRSSKDSAGSGASGGQVLSGNEVAQQTSILVEPAAKRQKIVVTTKAVGVAAGAAIGGLISSGTTTSTTLLGATLVPAPATTSASPATSATAVLTKAPPPRQKVLLLPREMNPHTRRLLSFRASAPYWKHLLGTSADADTPVPSWIEQRAALEFVAPPAWMQDTLSAHAGGRLFFSSEGSSSSTPGVSVGGLVVGGTNPSGGSCGLAGAHATTISTGRGAPSASSSTTTGAALLLTGTSKFASAALMSGTSNKGKGQGSGFFAQSVGPFKNANLAPDILEHIQTIAPAAIFGSSAKGAMMPHLLNTSHMQLMREQEWEKEEMKFFSNVGTTSTSSSETPGTAAPAVAAGGASGSATTTSLVIAGAAVATTSNSGSSATNAPAPPPVAASASTPAAAAPAQTATTPGKGPLPTTAAPTTTSATAPATSASQNETNKIVTTSKNGTQRVVVQVGSSQILSDVQNVSASGSTPPKKIELVPRSGYVDPAIKEAGGASEGQGSGEGHSTLKDESSSTSKTTTGNIDKKTPTPTSRAKALEAAHEKLVQAAALATKHLQPSEQKSLQNLPLLNQFQVAKNILKTRIHPRDMLLAISRWQKASDDYTLEQQLQDDYFAEELKQEMKFKGEKGGIKGLLDMVKLKDPNPPAKGGEMGILEKMALRGIGVENRRPRDPNGTVVTQENFASLTWDPWGQHQHQYQGWLDQGAAPIIGYSAGATASDENYANLNETREKYGYKYDPATGQWYRQQDSSAAGGGGGDDTEKGYWAEDGTWIELVVEEPTAGATTTA